MCLNPKPTNFMSIHSASPRPSPAIVSPSSAKTITSIAPSTSIMKQERRKLTTRRVRFSHSEIVGTVVDRSEIPIEDYQNIWYFAHELESFKTEVRDACETIRGNSAAPSIYNNSTEFPTRGLEQRMCKNRQRNKALGIWGTLKAQQRNKDPEFISMIARKCSFTAVQLAYMEAARDYCEIYNPSETAALSARIEEFAAQSFPIKLKRKSPDSSSTSSDRDCGANDANGRNVRIRIN